MVNHLTAIAVRPLRAAAWGFAYLSVVLVLPVTHGAESFTEEELLFYESEVRPILARRCYECHSGETDNLQGELRLDGRTAMVTGGYSGPAVVPHQPEESLLYKAVEYLDPALQMPPSERLSDREIAVLKDWIERGAPAPAGEATDGPQTIDVAARRDAHWAWQPVKRPELPKVAQEDWARDDFDRFILARLEAAGLSPASEAERLVWLRRVTFDLTGLPPTREEIDNFLADSSPNAYAVVVDRLLASPAFGEAWGQHWLDLMRYAETKGHEGDYKLPNAWRYRDYVIRAFNANVPYNQFVREHIAGDRIAPPRLHPETKANESIIGTAFWHLGEATHSPVDIRGEEADRVDNQIDTFSKAFLGMTVACSRCHDHKFDAIPQSDYYAIAGFLQSSSYQQVDTADPALRQQLSEQLQELNAEAARKIMSEFRRQTEPRLERLARDMVAAMQEPVDRFKVAMLDTPESPDNALACELHLAHEDPLHGMHAVAQALARATVGREASIASPGEAFQPITLFEQPTSSEGADPWLTTGYAFGDAPRQAGELLLQTDRRRNPLRVVEHPSAAVNGGSYKLRGIYRTKTFEITGPSLWYAYRGRADVFLDVDSHRTIYAPLHTAVEQKLNSYGKIAWFQHPVGPYVGHRVHVDFTPRGDFELFAVGFAPTRPGRPRPLAQVELGRSPMVDISSDSLVDEVARMFRDALTAIDEARGTSDDAALVNWLLENEQFLPPASKEERAKLDALVEEWNLEREKLERQIPPRALVPALVDGTPEEEYVHLRGNHQRLADTPTPRRFLEAWQSDLGIETGSGRPELAERVVDPENPLTARVWANRIWGYLTGRGIVPTVDNFGVLGDPPTHPELLDYLADELVDSGWDTKAMIRRIVLSSTYRQSSDANSAAGDIDPANNLLHKARVRRIAAESIRDSLFAISGELNTRQFGRSVPIHITDFMRNNRSPDWSGPMDGRRRRSIYVEVRRNALSHFLTAFDRPTPASTVGRRNQSNTASQPLVLLNDPLVHQLCGKWAEILVAEHQEDAAALEAAYLAAFARKPSKAEQQEILPYLAQRTEQAGRAEAWSDVTLALVNMKEFIFLP